MEPYLSVCRCLFDDLGMNRGGLMPDNNCFLSLGDAQEHRQATFDLHQCIRVNVPEGWS